MKSSCIFSLLTILSFLELRAASVVESGSLDGAFHDHKIEFLADRLYRAVVAGDFESVKTIVAENNSKSFINKISSEQTTSALFAAITLAIQCPFNYERKQSGSKKSRKKENASLVKLPKGDDYLEIADFLLKNGADPDSKEFFSQKTPLMEAAISGHIEAARLLLGHGADITIKDAWGKDVVQLTEEMKPAHASGDHIQILCLLLEEKQHSNTKDDK